MQTHIKRRLGHEVNISAHIPPDKAKHMAKPGIRVEYASLTVGQTG